MAGKKPSRLRFSTEYSNPWTVFRNKLLTLAGVDFLVLVRQKRYRGKTRASSVAVRNFCSLPVRARRCRTVSSSAHWKLVSYPFLWTIPAMLPVFLRPYTNAQFGERRKRSMAALRWISSMNFCKLMCHLSSWRKCKNYSERHSVLPLTFLLSVSKIWCRQD